MSRVPRVLGALAAALAGAALHGCGGSDGPAPGGIALDVAPPARLSETGLYSDVATRTVEPGNLAFTPQYPLWTDGAVKHRWIHLPPGTSIDARNMDAWSFPVGTKIWKEFAFGRPVETRYMERLADGRWLLAAYAWDEQGGDARVAPDRGLPSVADTGLGTRHDVPSRRDCVACHGGRDAPPLGFTALQLSPDRDPLAPHAESRPRGAVDVASLIDSGRLVTRSDARGTGWPRIDARTPIERAALGYLMANCATCHRDAGDLAALAFSFEPKAAHDGAMAGIATTFGVRSRFRFPGAPDDALARIAPGAPERSAVTRRMASRDPLTQMPPLGTHVVDREGLARVEEWIRAEADRPKALSSHEPE